MKYAAKINISICCMILLATVSRAQHFTVMPYVGLGNYTAGSHANGRGVLGIKAAYSVSNAWSLGVDLGIGGNLLFGDDQVLDNTDIKIINGRSTNFGYYGISQQYNLNRSGKANYVYLSGFEGIGILTVKNVGLAENETIQESNLSYGLGLGLVLHQLDLQFQYLNLGRLEEFNGMTDDNRPALIAEVANRMLFLKLGYRF